MRVFWPGISAAVVLGLAAAACARGGTGPRLTASWTGADTSRIDAAAKAAWCPVAGRLQVTAIREDLGFGLAVYPVGDLGPGEFPGIDAGLDTTVRPGATAAMRKYTERSIIAYQSDSGSLTLAREGAGFGAQFEFRLQSVDRSGLIRVKGEAHGLVPGACSADSVPAAAPVQ